jgi:hypothetical protein
MVQGYSYLIQKSLYPFNRFDTIANKQVTNQYSSQEKANKKSLQHMNQDILWYWSGKYVGF